jgi:hypothetical protein
MEGYNKNSPSHETDDTISVPSLGTKIVKYLAWALQLRECVGIQIISWVIYRPSYCLLFKE